MVVVVVVVVMVVVLVVGPTYSDRGVGGGKFALRDKFSYLK